MAKSPDYLVEKQEIFTLPWQNKSESGITTSGVQSGLTFHNLVIGKTYKIRGHASQNGSAATQLFIFRAMNGATEVTKIDIELIMYDGDSRNATGFSETFTATADTLEFDIVSNANNNAVSVSWTLEESPNLVETTQFDL